MYAPRDVGGLVKPVSSIRPVDQVAAATFSKTGVAVDRRGFKSAELVVQTGAVGGAPSAQTVDAKVQESDDGSTGWADVTGAAITQITAANTQQRVSLDLTARKRYLRVVATIAFTAGTSPTIGLNADLILGGADKVPTT